MYNFLFTDSGGVPEGKGFKCTGGIMASEAVSLLRTFYEQGNPNGMLLHHNNAGFESTG